MTTPPDYPLTFPKYEWDILIYIGRFAPVHYGHHATIKLALDISKYVIIGIGSAFDSRTTRVPWSYEERRDMLEIANHNFERKDNIRYVPLTDFPYNNEAWKRNVRNQVERVRSDLNIENPKIGIIGFNKDETSWYIKAFPEWAVVESPAYTIKSGTDESILNATQIRNSLFEGNVSAVSGLIDPNVLIYHTLRINHHAFNQLRVEYKCEQDYKKKWSVAPYPPFIVAGDCVVVHEYQILLITRGKQPGYGMLALPGGHIEQHETLNEGTLRELIEETCIDLTLEELEKLTIGSRIFDHPKRSQRARVISNTLLLEIPLRRERPNVKAADDARTVGWYNVEDIHKMRDMFFEDHYHIICTMLDLY